MKKSFLLTTVASSILLAMNTAYAKENVEQLDTIEVSADASQTGLSKEFAGGQVASGSRIGILGNKSNLESSFATTSYTNKFIQDKQARSVADVLKTIQMSVLLVVLVISKSPILCEVSLPIPMIFYITVYMVYCHVNISPLKCLNV